jgi:hypothetical protein
VRNIAKSSSVLVALLVLEWGCSTEKASKSPEQAGGAGGSGATGGTAATGGAGPTGGAGGSGAATCSNANLNTIPIDSTGWVARECNNFGIQGAWYCYDDGVNDSSCTTGTPPFRPQGGMCLSGTTTLDPTFAAWGGGIGLSLNETGGVGSVKSPFNATTSGVTGFAITIAGTSGGNAIRVNFSGAANTAGRISPFVQLPGAGTYEVNLADAMVPTTWDVPEAGTTADPANIFDMQVQVVGGETNAAYDFCITQVDPIGPGIGGSGGTGGAGGTGGSGGVLPTYGEPQCGRYDRTNLGNRYMIQNNIWNDAATGGQQCVQALWDGSGDRAGFIVNPASINVNTPAPGSYPSIVYGWHYGTFYGGYTQARQLQSITAVPSTWSFTAPNAGRHDVSYDLWLHPQTNPSTPAGGLELMIWLNTRDATPIGGQVGSITTEGATWEVWYGQNAGWNTVSFKRVGNTTDVNMNLRPFINEAVQRGYAQNAWYLLSVQAGYELWQNNQGVQTNSFSVSVN